MSTAYLSWPDARLFAIAGKFVRREGWPLVGSSVAWIRHRTGLWEMFDVDYLPLGVVTATKFASAEFHADDWTIDPPGTVRDACARAPKRLRFLPPGIGLKGTLGTTTIYLHADIGESFPSGCYVIDYYLDGAFVGTMEAPIPGRYTLSTSADYSLYSTAGRIRAWIDVRSSLPLPTWAGHAEWQKAFPSLSFLGTYYRPVSEGGAGPCEVRPATLTNEFGEAVSWRWLDTANIEADWLSGTLSALVTIADDSVTLSWSNGTTWVRFRYATIDLSVLFPNDGISYGVGWYRGLAGVVCGPYAGDRWIYSHADNPAAADDDLAVNGTVIFPNGYADYLNGGATTLLHVLPAGMTFNLNIWNGGGWCSGSGELRLYTRPI